MYWGMRCFGALVSAIVLSHCAAHASMLKPDSNSLDPPVVGDPMQHRAAFPPVDDSGRMFAEYAVLGSGVAGVQAGHFLHASQRSYVILERAFSAGSFFQSYPKFRKLISINKRHTTRRDLEFRMRHDWNSILQDLPLAGYGSGCLHTRLDSNASNPAKLQDGAS